MRSTHGRSRRAAARSRRCSSHSWRASAFLTALGDDELGHRAKGSSRRSAWVEATWRAGATAGGGPPGRRGERTITVIGDRLGPRGDDHCPGRSFGDRRRLLDGRRPGPSAGPGRPESGLDSPRARPLAEAGVELDVLVSSATTRASATSRASSIRRRWLVARTAGAAGGSLGGGGAADATRLRRCRVRPSTPTAPRLLRRRADVRAGGDLAAAGGAWRWRPGAGRPV